MFVIFIRTIIIFILLEFVVRLMGKRHMGELEIGELITTIMISEIATLPLQDTSIPILYAFVPISVLMVFEIGSSVILTKIPKLKSLVTPGPSVIIEKGKLNQAELKRLRISVEELMSALRQNNVSDIEEVNYAIMEQNAMITVIPKVKYSPPTSEAMNVIRDDPGIPHIIISDGKIDERNLKILGKDHEWLERELSNFGYSKSEVFLMTIDDCEKIRIIKKEKNK